MLFTGGKIDLAGDMAIKLQYFVDKGGGNVFEFEHGVKHLNRVVSISRDGR